MQGYKLTGSTGFALITGDESSSIAGARLGILESDWRFLEPNLIGLLPGREVSCGICYLLETISRHFIYSPNVWRAGAATSRCICSLATSGTLKSNVPHF